MSAATEQADLKIGCRYRVDDRFFHVTDTRNNPDFEVDVIVRDLSEKHGALCELVNSDRVRWIPRNDVMECPG